MICALARFLEVVLSLLCVQCLNQPLRIRGGCRDDAKMDELEEDSSLFLRTCFVRLFLYAFLPSLCPSESSPMRYIKRPHSQSQARQASRIAAVLYTAVIIEVGQDFQSLVIAPQFGSSSSWPVTFHKASLLAG
jgi:hypothetical protein